MTKKTIYMPLLMLLAVACGFSTPQHVASRHIEGLELPAYSADEDIVRHTGYTASYNHTTLCPNWVAWELTSDEVGGSCDANYPFSWDPDVARPKASREDYSRSGWDKGHMAPRADMRWDCRAMEESYFFTNVCPQDHEMNSQAWRKIEEMTRRTARRHGAVWVVCGPLYDNAEHRLIGAVHVPDRFFKALAIQLADSSFATIGFLVENNRQDGAPKRYAVTVDAVEAVVERNLFPTLPEEVERTFDINLWK